MRKSTYKTWSKKIGQPKNEPAIKSYHHEKAKITTWTSYIHVNSSVKKKIPEKCVF